MAEHWIDAASAAKLVTDGPSGLAGRRALCARAHRSLVQTKARLLILKGRELVSRQEHVAVPAELWDAEGATEFQQDWAAGDFSAQLDDDTRIEAFGVTFGMSGLLELLAPEKRAIVARGLSVAGNAAWVTAREARRFASEKTGVLKSGAILLDHARLGLVSARAVLAQETKYNERTRASSVTWEQREWDVPTWFWRDFFDADGYLHDWERGRFEGSGLGQRGYCSVTLDAVHFLAESLQVLVPAQTSAGAPDIEPKAQGKGGGQPPRAFWDDMIIAVAGLVHHGQLTPSSQAEVTDAMLTWAAVNGHEISESAVKPKAKKLFKTYQTEGKNFLKGSS